MSNEDTRNSEEEGICPLCGWSLAAAMDTMQECPHFLWMHGGEGEDSDTGVGDFDQRWRELFQRLYDARKTFRESIYRDPFLPLLLFSEPEDPLPRMESYLGSLVKQSEASYGWTNYYPPGMGRSEYMLYWTTDRERFRQEIEPRVEQHIAYFQKLTTTQEATE